jgi:hypothetical protein
MKTQKILIFALVFGILFALYIASVSATAQNQTCVQNAVIQRETALGIAYQKLTTEMVGVFSNRSQSLVIAYGLEDKKERNAAIKLAWKNYKDGYKLLVTEFKDSRKSAWNTFNSQRAACKSQKESSDSENNEIRL